MKDLWKEMFVSDSLMYMSMITNHHILGNYSGTSILLRWCRNLAEISLKKRFLRKSPVDIGGRAYPSEWHCARGCRPQGLELRNVAVGSQRREGSLRDGVCNEFRSAKASFPRWRRSGLPLLEEVSHQTTNVDYISRTLFWSYGSVQDRIYLRLLSYINLMPYSLEEGKERCPHILKPAKGMGYAAVCSGKKPGSFASDVVTILLDIVHR